MFYETLDDHLGDITDPLFSAVVTDEQTQRMIEDCERELGMTLDEFLHLRAVLKYPDTYAAMLLMALLDTFETPFISDLLWCAED